MSPSPSVPARLMPVTLLCVAACGGAPAADSGISLGPGLIMVRNIPPGETVDLGEIAGVLHTARNHGAGPTTIDFVASRPASYNFGLFECGFDAPPDEVGLRLRYAAGVDATEAGEVVVPGKGSASGSLVIELPDEPRFYNRHFAAFVEAGQGNRSPLGMAVRMRARILFETAPAPPPAEGPPPGGVIAVAPATVMMVPATDGTWSGTARIGNNDDRGAELDLLRVHEVYTGEDSDKQPRFFEGAHLAVLGEDWARPETESFHLAAGEGRAVRFTAPPGRNVEADSYRDEVFFVARRYAGEWPPARGTVRQVGDRLYDRMELLRLRYQVPAEEGATRR